MGSPGGENGGENDGETLNYFTLASCDEVEAKEINTMGHSWWKIGADGYT